jgi:hypothetical protein
LQIHCGRPRPVNSFEKFASVQIATRA